MKILLQKEAERIIFEDQDPRSGFILLPDLKWASQCRAVKGPCCDKLLP